MSDDLLKSYRNNLAHAQKVYLSALRNVPAELLTQEIFMLLGAAKNLCPPEKSDIWRRLDDAQWAFLEE